MKNLLFETKDSLNQAGKTFDDVIWIGTKDGSAYMTTPQFLVAANKKYDSGYGGAEVSTDLVIVGIDWWLERGEYDGSEWWDFQTLPKKAEDGKQLETIWERR